MMDVREEIIDFISRNEITGALLLTGQWGCGKSYLIKEIAKNLNDKNEAAIATVSLFGLDSVATINTRVKEEYSGFMLGSFGKQARRISRKIESIVKDGLEVADKATGGLAGLSAASHGLSAIMSYDMFSFFDVKNIVGKDGKTRKFVLVFDDLERSNVDKKDLLGTINEYMQYYHGSILRKK